MSFRRSVRPLALRTVRLSAVALAAAGFAALGAATGAGAQAIAGFNSNQPVDFAADRIELQDRQQRVVLSGSVVINQGDLRLTAARTTVAYTHAGSLEIQRIDATGGVVVTRGNERARCSAEHRGGDVGLRREGRHELGCGPCLEDAPVGTRERGREARVDSRAGRDRERDPALAHGGGPLAAGPPAHRRHEHLERACARGDGRTSQV